MSSFAWMRVLESAAERYDRGMRMLSRGRIDAVYRRVAAAACGRVAGREEGAANGAGPDERPLHVLDIGCGTGGVALACAASGARVVGVDRSASMLDVARGKPLPTGADGRVTWLELGAAEIEDRFPPESFDAVTSCLVFSELSPEGRAYTLSVALTLLAPGGRLVLADEVEPAGRLPRLLRRATRSPVAALAYLLTQTSTRPLADPARLVSEAGFVEVDEERLWGGAFAIVTAAAPARKAGPRRRAGGTGEDAAEAAS